MTTLYTIHPADNMRASVFGPARVPIDSRYSSAAELCQAIRAAAETAPECLAPRVKRAFPAGAYNPGPSEIVMSDSGRSYYGQAWHGPLMPEPAQPDVIRVEFHFAANGARSSITAANLRPDLLRLADRVHAARNLYDGKVKRAPRPAKPASSAPHVTARGLWASGDRAGALAIARNVGAVFFGACGRGNADAPHPYMMAESMRASDEDFVIARSIPSGRFRVLHLETACAADPDGFKSSADALAWLEERSQCEDWRAKLCVAIAKAPRFDQSSALARYADDSTDDEDSDARPAANDPGAPLDPGPAAPAGQAPAEIVPTDDDMREARAIVESFYAFHLRGAPGETIHAEIMLQRARHLRGSAAGFFTSREPSRAAPYAEAARMLESDVAAKRAPVYAPDAPMSYPADIGAALRRGLDRQPFGHLPLFARVAIERLDADSGTRNSATLASLLDDYARTYGTQCDDSTRASAHYICGRRFWDFAAAPDDAHGRAGCTKRESIEQRAPDPAPVKESPYPSFCPVRAAVYRAHLATAATARAIEGYGADNPEPAGAWDDRIAINRLRARGADRPTGAQALRDRVAAAVRADRAARRAVPMASPGYAFPHPLATHAASEPGPVPTHSDAAAEHERTVTAADPYATDTHERPCAAPGLTSYRARGVWGWIMIGATDEEDAMREARRSTHAPHSLQVWDGTAYVPCDQANPLPVESAPPPADTGPTAPVSRPGRVMLILHNVLVPLQNAAPDGVPSVAGLESEARRIEAAAESMVEGAFANDGARACALRARTDYREVARSLRELAEHERARLNPDPVPGESADDDDDTAPAPLDGLDVADLGADGLAEFERAGGELPKPTAPAYSDAPRAAGPSLRIPATDPRARIPARFAPVYCLRA